MIYSGMYARTTYGGTLGLRDRVLKVVRKTSSILTSIAQRVIPLTVQTRIGLVSNKSNRTVAQTSQTKVSLVSKSNNKIMLE